MEDNDPHKRKGPKLIGCGICFVGGFLMKKNQINLIVILFLMGVILPLVIGVLMKVGYMELP